MRNTKGNLKQHQSLTKFFAGHTELQIQQVARSFITDYYGMLNHTHVCYMVLFLWWTISKFIIEQHSKETKPRT